MKKTNLKKPRLLPLSVAGIAVACVLTLSACGGGTEIEDALDVQRVVVFGDAMSDAGQMGGLRYTVNDASGSNRTWAERIATRLGASATASSTGGTNYAYGGALVSGAAPTSIESQIASAGNFGGDDLVLMTAGTAEIQDYALKVKSNALTEKQALDEIDKVTDAYIKRIEEIIDNGGNYVAVTNTYDLGETKWAKDNDVEAVATKLTDAFTDAVKVKANELDTAKVFYIETGFAIDRYVGGRNGFEEGIAPVCTGAGATDALQCTDSTLVAGADENDYVFSDYLHLSPRAHIELADYAIDRIRDRWIK